MPFVEVGSTQFPKYWIKWYGQNRKLSVSQSVREEYFNGKQAKVFFDEENSLLGLKPSDEGYKISEGTIAIADIKKYRIKRKVRFPACWNEEHGMVIAKIEREEETVT